MENRNLSLIDRLVGSLDNALKTVTEQHASSTRPNPSADVPDSQLADGERRHAAGLMRINHAGEVAAQALYQGHAALARDPGIAQHMRDAAVEERDHLLWCEERLQELGAGPSRLSPFWYAGAFAIGAASSALGDRWSLGFVAETERQVADHLKDHLDRLPAKDARSRAIVRQMREEEAAHCMEAEQKGAAELPRVVRKMMQMSAQVMKRSAYWL
ncbi:MAG: 2-polyprenyl-3-methyl-6-methoxy-1,4-benzoquinone monooxygenase [Woeseia sp.]|nr:2-polyprenyl-3-methyl-6-methoxy-1,4-benzoquinone monooxygenase [Woeseia sp.]